MVKIAWDEKGKHTYETGTDHGVLYAVDEDGAYGKGVAWNGLTKVTESPEGAEATDIYADNIKYLSLLSAESLKGTIEAYTYPDEFGECDGTVDLVAGVTVGQQNRKMFGFSYRTLEGNDTKGDAYGEKIHLIYGAKASPSERAYETVNDAPAAVTFSWAFTTTPEEVDGTHKPTASITLSKDKTTPEIWKTITDTLYGSDTSTEAKLPTPKELLSLLKVPAPTEGTGSKD